MDILKIIPEQTSEKMKVLFSIFEETLKENKGKKWKSIVENIYNKNYNHDENTLNIILSLFNYHYYKFYSLDKKVEEQFNKYFFENLILIKKNKMSKKMLVLLLEYLNLNISIYVLNTSDYIDFIRVDELLYQSEYSDKDVVHYKKLDMLYTMDSGNSFNDTYNDTIHYVREDNRTSFLEVEIKVDKRYDNNETKSNMEQFFQNSKFTEILSHGNINNYTLTYSIDGIQYNNGHIINNNIDLINGILDIEFSENVDWVRIDYSYKYSYVWYRDLFLDLMTILDINRYINTKYLYTLYYNFKYTMSTNNKFYDNGIYIRRLSGLDNYNLITDNGIKTDKNFIIDLSSDSILSNIKKAYCIFDEIEILIDIEVNKSGNELSICIESEFTEYIKVNNTDMNLSSDLEIKTDKGYKTRKYLYDGDLTLREIIICDNDNLQQYFSIGRIDMYFPHGSKLKFELLVEL